MIESIELFQVNDELLDEITGGCCAPYCHNGA